MHAGYFLCNFPVLPVSFSEHLSFFQVYVLNQEFGDVASGFHLHYYQPQSAAVVHKKL